MSKQYKHKKTGDIAIEKEPRDKFPHGYLVETNFIPCRFIESSDDWHQTIEYPIGTKIKNITGVIFEKIQGELWRYISFRPYHSYIDESKIGTEYQLVEDKDEWIWIRRQKDGTIKQSNDSLSWEVLKKDFYRIPTSTTQAIYVLYRKQISREGKVYEIKGTVNTWETIECTEVEAYSWWTRKPKFIAEDGKEMFVGDKYWAVMDFLVERWAYDVLQNTDYSHNPVRKFFSTYKAAEKWIDDNKSIYSKKELRDVLGLEYQFSVGATVNISYLKDKLKL